MLLFICLLLCFYVFVDVIRTPGLSDQPDREKGKNTHHAPLCGSASVFTSCDVSSLSFPLLISLPVFLGGRGFPTISEGGA